MGDGLDIDLFSYAQIASLAGVTQGTLVNEGSGWLRFELDNMELIVAKKGVRQAISWDHLNSLGCVFGEKIVTIDGNDYKVRLLKGADENPTSVGVGYYREGTHESEWSRLFYPIITDDTYIPAGMQGTNGNYLQTDLGLKNDGYQWCQETRVGYANHRVLRGSRAASYLYFDTSSLTNTSIRWRPCLERI